MQQVIPLQVSTQPAGNAEGDRLTIERYSYYRRCQLFRRNGDQCKAPAEKGSAICHAHAAQQAMALRRERERRAVLAEAVAEMRRQGKAECETADLFTDFKGIQVTLAVMAQALIDGRIIARQQEGWWCSCKRCRNCCGLFTVKKHLPRRHGDTEKSQGCRSFAQIGADCATRESIQDCG